MRTKTKARLKLLAVLLGVGYVLPWAAFQVATPALIGQLNDRLGIQVASGRWHWPFGLTFEKVNIPDPTGSQPFFLKADSITLRVPFWGFPVWMASGTLPAKVTVVKPVLRADSQNAGKLIASVSVHPLDWLYIPSGGVLETGGPGPEGIPTPPVAPLELIVVGGRAEVWEEEIREGKPLFIVDHVHARLAAEALLGKPVLAVESYGHFVTEAGDLVGMHHIAIRARPLEKYVEGSLRIRHEQLEDFRNLYAHAPYPIYIEGGLTDFITTFRVTEGRNLWFRASTMVDHLDLSARVGEVSFADIMHAVEDENRRYRWVFEVAGDLSDPTFDPHDRILREVELEMKELAAARGLKVEAPLFFYSDMEWEEPE